MTQNQNEKMRDFIASLENNQFSKDQEAMLLVGNAEDLQAGETKNGSCENTSSTCDNSSNGRRCTNVSESGCDGSSNKRCASIGHKGDFGDVKDGMGFED